MNPTYETMIRDYTTLLDACAISAVGASIDVELAVFHLETTMCGFRVVREFRERRGLNWLTIEDDWGYAVTFIYDHRGRVRRAARWNTICYGEFRRF